MIITTVTSMKTTKTPEKLSYLRKVLEENKDKIPNLKYLNFVVSEYERGLLDFESLRGIIMELYEIEIKRLI